MTGEKGLQRCLLPGRRPIHESINDSFVLPFRDKKDSSSFFSRRPLISFKASICPNKRITLQIFLWVEVVISQLWQMRCKGKTTWRGEK